MDILADILWNCRKSRLYRNKDDIFSLLKKFLYFNLKDAKVDVRGAAASKNGGQNAFNVKYCFTPSFTCWCKKISSIYKPDNICL